MKNPLIEITDFSGGMTLNKKMGRADQFALGASLDFSSARGYLSPGVAYVRVKADGGSNFATTEFTHILQTIKDGNAWFFGEDTKIYYLDGESELKEASDSDQTGVFKGAAEYKSYLLYMQDTTLGAKNLASAYNAGYTHNFKTGFSAADYHPIKTSANNTAYIGNGQYIASVTDPADNGTVSLTALDLADNWQVRCLDDFGYSYLAIGANYVTSTYESSKCKVFLWNRSDASWTDEIIVPENEIKAMKYVAGYLWIWAGKSCNLYVVPDGSRKATKIWQFSREDPTAEFEVYPGAVTARGGTVHFALSGGDAVSILRYQAGGLYSFSANPEKFSLNRPWRYLDYLQDYKGVGLVNNMIYISHESKISGSDIRTYRENIGANELHYKDIGRYYSYKFPAPKNKRIHTEAFGVTFEPLVAGCNISLYYDGNYGDGAYIFQDFSTTNAEEKIVRFKVIADSLQLTLYIRGTNTGTNYTNRPFIKSIWVTGSLIAK